MRKGLMSTGLLKGLADRASLLETLETAFIALGKAGGNTVDSPYRKAWEAVREAIKLAGGRV